MTNVIKSFWVELIGVGLIVVIACMWCYVKSIDRAGQIRNLHELQACYTLSEELYTRCGKSTDNAEFLKLVRCLKVLHEALDEVVDNSDSRTVEELQVIAVYFEDHLLMITQKGKGI
jgi:hypothetical protein